MTKPLEHASWDRGVLVIDDAADIKKIRRKWLSPSAASDIRKCPASFAAGRLIPRSETPFDPAPLGTATHEVMEHLYQLEPENRTREFVLGELDRLSLDIDEGDRERWLAITTPRALGIFSLENPADIDVHSTELAVGGWNYEAKKLYDIQVDIPGLRVAVPFSGKIDRIRFADPEHSALLLDDYKFPGSKPKAPSKNFEDSYGEQQRLYAIVLEMLFGKLPAEARLLYPEWNHTRVIDLSEAALRTTRLKYEQSFITQNRACDEGRFSTTPGNLCGWCPLANACPVAKITTVKAIGNAAAMRSANDLGVSVASRHPKPSPYALTSGLYLGMPAMPQAVAAPAEADLTQSDASRAEPETTSLTDPPSTGHSYHQKETTTMTLKYPTNNFAAMSVCSIADLATDHLHALSVPLSVAAIDAFATVLTDICLTISRNLFDTADFSHGSFSRIEYSLKQSLTVYPAPFGNGETSWAEWRKNIGNITVAKLNTAWRLLEADAVPADAYRYFIPAGQLQSRPAA